MKRAYTVHLDWPDHGQVKFVQVIGQMTNAYHLVAKCPHDPFNLMMKERGFIAPCDCGCGRDALTIRGQIFIHNVITEVKEIVYGVQGDEQTC